MAATISKTNAKKLREQRADLIDQAQSYVAEHEDDQGLLSAEDQEAVDKMLADAHGLNDQITTRETLEQAVGGLNQPLVGRGQPTTPASDPGATFDDADARQAAAARGGRSGRTIMVRQGLSRDGKPNYIAQEPGARGTADYHAAFCQTLEHRMPAGQFAALQSDNPEQAGYLLASEQFSADFLQEVDDLVLIRRFADVETVPTADSLGIKSRTAKLSTFAYTAELQVATADSSLKFGKRLLTPHPFTGQIQVSRDLLRRGGAAVEQKVRAELARDAAEVEEQHFLTGNGAEQPLDVLTASADGIPTSRDVDTGSATGFTYAGLVNAIYSLKAAYRRGGARSGARFMINRTGINKIALLQDGDGHPLWRPGRGLLDSDPDTILGVPLDESEFVPNTFTASQYVGILANWRYFKIADALDMEIQVLMELDARTNQVGYIARMKNDGAPVLAEAFVRLQTSAS